MIETRFKDFRFIPFQICKHKIDGLDVRYTDENLSSIFNALFNDQIDLTSSTIGSDYFKSEDWIKDGYAGDKAQWTAYPLSFAVLPPTGVLR